MKHKIAVIATLTNRERSIREWVHHYIYFGYSRLFLGTHAVNSRTSKTFESIAKTHPQVKIFNFDWLHKGVAQRKHPNTNMLIYAFLTDHIRRHHPEISYSLYNDSSDYWFPSALQPNIDTILDQTQCYDAATVPVINASTLKERLLRKATRKICVTPNHRPILRLRSSNPILEFRNELPVYKNKARILELSSNNDCHIVRQGALSKSPPPPHNRNTGLKKGIKSLVGDLNPVQTNSIIAYDNYLISLKAFLDKTEG